MFIDYQFMSMSHPAKDLWYLLTANTDKVCSLQMAFIFDGHSLKVFKLVLLLDISLKKGHLRCVYECYSYS